jgi:hypothetical protein
VQSTGSIVAAGSGTPSSSSPTGTVSEFFAFQLSTAGAQNPSFFNYALNPTYYGASAMALDPSDNAVVVGDNGGPMAVERLQSTGGTDLFFGMSGWVSTNISNYDFPGGVAVQADGKIDVQVSTNGQSLQTDRVALVRYLSTGALDTTFGGGVVKDVYAGAPYYTAGIGLQRDGRIIVAASRPANADAGTVTAAVLLRFWP